MKTRILVAGALAAPLMFALLASTASAAVLSSQLSEGSTGPDVTSLQTFLATNSTIYPSGLVTGYYGSLTEAAVARWQAANGIEATGNVGPITLAAINAAMGDNGGAPITTTGGVIAPNMTPESVSTTPNSATFAWTTTNEPAYASVMYGTSYPFLYASAPSVEGTSGLSTSQDVTITGLQPGTTYYYTLQSQDASGVYSWTVEKPFTTQP